MDSLFTKILKREIPAEIIYEDEYSFVIPDKFPSMPGQILVISKRQTPYLLDLTPTEYTGLLTTVNHVARALDKALGATRTCFVIEGFEVPHVHVRLYPCQETSLILEPRQEATATSLALLAKQVREALGNV